MAAVITLTTDLGLKDNYVGAMKGVILGINPDAIIVDISHDVTPHNVKEGAFLLSTAYPYFPQGTIHLVVIDPGVGTGRQALIVEGSGYYYVAPDNGVLSYVLADALGDTPYPPHLPSNFTAVSITQNRFWRPSVSDTFHGRDIFAPVAAHLSLGVSLEEFGDLVTSILAFRRSSPVTKADGGIQGEVVHIDGFGNLITNVRAEVLPPGNVALEVGLHRVKGISRSYEEGKGLLAIIGSAGYLEISQKNGSAAAKIKAKIGTAVIIRPADWTIASL